MLNMSISMHLNFDAKSQREQKVAVGDDISRILLTHYSEFANPTCPTLKKKNRLTLILINKTKYHGNIYLGKSHHWIFSVHKDSFGFTAQLLPPQEKKYF